MVLILDENGNVIRPIPTEEILLGPYSPLKFRALLNSHRPTDCFNKSREENSTTTFENRNSIKLYSRFLLDIYSLEARASGDPYVKHIFEMGKAYLEDGFISPRGINLVITHDGPETLIKIFRKTGKLPPGLEGLCEKPYDLYEVVSGIASRYEITNVDDLLNMYEISNEPEDKELKHLLIPKLADSDSAIPFVVKCYDIWQNCTDPQNLGPNAIERKRRQIKVAREIMDRKTKTGEIVELFSDIDCMTPNEAAINIYRRLSTANDNLDRYSSKLA